MKADKHLLQRNAKKLALTNNARLKRMARRKLENRNGSTAVTEDMVSSALAQRKINQVDELTRRTNHQYQFNQRQKAPPKFDAITLGQLPAKPLKRNVLWLSLPQQEATANVSLSTELECFAQYVQLDDNEEAARISMLLDIQDAVQSKFPYSRVSQFGSHPVGLSIFLSDVDVSVDNTSGDAPLPLPLSGKPSTTPTITPKRLSNTALVSSIVRRDSFGSNMSDGTIKRSSSLVDNPINKRIKFSDSEPVEGGTTSATGEEEDIEVSWSIDNISGDTPALVDTSSTATSSGLNESKPTGSPVKPSTTRMTTREAPKQKHLGEDCFDSSDSSHTDSDFSAEGLSEPEDEEDESASEEIDDRSENDYFEELLNELEEDRSEDENSLEDGEEGENEENEEFEGYSEPLKIDRTPSVNSLRFDEDGAVAPVSTEKKVKLPLDIDVPFWDGANSVNAAESNFDGVLDETLAENLYLMDSSALKAVKINEQESRREKLDILAKLYKTIKSMGWVQRIEFRKHARVPILNLTHKCGVECDVSLDMSQQATSLVVKSMMQRSGPALAKLSAFLKIYLSQLGLDAPFTGGLGSYKLYVLLAKHIDRQKKDVTASSDLGPLLLSFLKFYSNRKNLNEQTVVDVVGAEDVAFDRTQKVNQLRLAFEKAYLILTKAHIERPSEQKNTHSYLASQVSSSQLGELLNCEHLARTRVQMRNKCAQYPNRSEAERDAVARKLLQELHGRVADTAPMSIGNATLEEVKATNPALAARLRSFPSAHRTSTHLDVAESSTVGTKRGRDIQEAEDMMLGVVETERPARIVPVVKTLEPPSKTTRVLLVTLPAGSPLEGLEKDMPMMTIQDNKPSKENRSFDYQVHHKIISGQEELPPGMKVPDLYLRRLPDHLVRALGPFRMLCVADTYLHKSYDELVAQEERQDAAVQKVQKLVAEGFFQRVDCHPAEKELLRKMVIANLIVENADMQLGLTKAELRLQEEARQAKVLVKLCIQSRAPLPVKRNVASSSGASAGASASSADVIDLTDDAPSTVASFSVSSSEAIPESSPLFSIQNDFLLFQVGVLGIKKFVDMVYEKYTTHAELSPVLLRQSLAAGKVKSLVSSKYFDSCLPVERDFLRQTVLTHLVGEKNTMKLNLYKEERRLINESGDAHLEVQDYLKYLLLVAQGKGPALNPRQEMEAQKKLPFDPKSRLGSLISQGKIPLPEEMVVAPEYRRKLPRVDQDKLQQFHSIAECLGYKTKSHKELLVLQKELLQRKKIYQKNFDKMNWDFFGPDDAARYPVLDDLISWNFISEPEEWTFTNSMRKRLARVKAMEEEFDRFVEERGAAEKKKLTDEGVGVSSSRITRSSTATERDAVQLGTSVEDEVVEMRDSSDDEAAVESDEEEEFRAYPSNGRAENELISQLERDIPLLVVLNPPTMKAWRLYSEGRIAKYVEENGLEQHPNMLVKQKHRHLLPAHVSASLGPFNMLCVAKYCLGKSYEDLVAQQDSQYAAVLRVKQLVEEGYFSKFPADSKEAQFLKRVLTSGLLFNPAAPTSDKRRGNMCNIASVSIIQYMNGMKSQEGSSDRYPAHHTRYPLRVGVDPTLASTHSTASSSNQQTRDKTAHEGDKDRDNNDEANSEKGEGDNDYEGRDNADDGDNDRDNDEEEHDESGSTGTVSTLIRELRDQIPLLVVLKRPKKRMSFFNKSLVAEICQNGLDAHPNMIVSKNEIRLLPAKWAKKLGPFRMLCVANYCLDKSIADLMKQQDAEHAAILKLKQLVEAGYFEDCSAEDLTFLRRVACTGLLTFQGVKDPFTGIVQHGFSKYEVKGMLECERAAKQIIQYIHRSGQRDYPSYDSRYPVHVAQVFPTQKTQPAVMNNKVLTSSTSVEESVVEDEVAVMGDSDEGEGNDEDDEDDDFESDGEEEETGDSSIADSGIMPAYPSMPPSHALIRQLEKDIPVLVALNPPRRKKWRLLLPGEVAQYVAKNGLENEPNMFVKPKHRHLLPKHVAATLGPFNMLCVAKYCLGKSRAELVQQQDTEYAAVLRAKQLFEEGYFNSCNAYDKQFFKRLEVAGLLRISYTPRNFSKPQKLLNGACTKINRSIVNYVNSLDSTQKYAYRYPVCLSDRGSGSGEKSSSIPPSASASASGTSCDVDVDIDGDKVEGNDASIDADSTAPSSNTSSKTSLDNSESPLIRELCREIPLLVALNRPHIDYGHFKPSMREEIAHIGLDAHPNMVVDPKTIHLLPAKWIEALGPFRMLCVAQYCVGKSFAELADQLDRQYAAVLKLKQLFDAGYFEDCSEEELTFLRSVAITSLIRFSSEVFFTKSEKNMMLRCERTSFRILEYMASRSTTGAQYPSYDSQYPVVLTGKVPQQLQAKSTSTPETSTPKVTHFNPYNQEGRDLMAGNISLPFHMNVEPQFRELLPKDMVAQLGPCKSLARRAELEASSYEELVQMLNKATEYKMLNQRKFDEDEWSYFNAKPHLINESIDRLIALGVLDLQPGRSMTDKQMKMRAAQLQLQEELRLFVAARRPADWRGIEPMEAPRAAAAPVDKANHLSSLLMKRKADEETRKEDTRAVVPKVAETTVAVKAAPATKAEHAVVKASKVVVAPPIVISSQARGVPIAKPVYALNRPSAPAPTPAPVATVASVSVPTSTASSSRTAPNSAVPNSSVGVKSTAPSAAMMALLANREKEQLGRAQQQPLAVPVGAKRSVEDGTHVTTLEAVKKVKVEAHVVPSVRDVRDVLAVPVQKVAATPAVPTPVVPVPVAPVVVDIVSSVAVPSSSTTEFDVDTTTINTPMEEVYGGYGGDEEQSFPSLSKPVVLSGRRGPGGRRSSAMGPDQVQPGRAVDVSPAVESIVQESQNILQEIDELKQRLDETKRRFSLE